MFAGPFQFETQSLLRHPILDFPNGFPVMMLRVNQNLYPMKLFLLFSNQKYRQGKDMEIMKKNNCLQADGTPTTDMSTGPFTKMQS